MRYAFVVALAALLGLASANPMAAQDRGRSNDDDTRVIVRGGDDDDRTSNRGRTSTERGRDDDRARGRTGSERGRDVESSRSDRTIGDIFGTSRRGDDRRQRRGDDDYDDDDWDDDDWDDDDWDDDDYRRNRRNAGKAGPPFCRNGQGHPVHGREWCRDKGFGGGDRYDDIIWDRRDRRDTRGIYFPSRRGDRYMSGSILQDVLGSVVYNRLGSHARNLRMSGPIRGRFNGPTELRVYAGSNPIARLIDSNRDGRADVVYFRR